MAYAFTGRMVFLGNDLARFINQMDKGRIVESRLGSRLPVELERHRVLAEQRLQVALRPAR